MIMNFVKIRSAPSARKGGDLQFRHPFSFMEKPSFSCSPYTHSFYGLSIGSLVLCKAREAFDTVQAVTDCSWNERVIASDNFVLVHFYAPWCGPCPILAPMIDELAKEYEGKVECDKMNIEEYPNISKQLTINSDSVPVVLLFKDGERKESIIGDVSKSALQADIEKYLDG